MLFSTFLLKLTLTPLLMLGVSVAGRKWGTFWGGLLSGLPLTSGVILTFLAAEQGSTFTQHAILGAVPGLASVLVTYAVYCQLSKRQPMWVTCLGALVAFVLTSILLTQCLPLFIAVLVLLATMTWLIVQTGREYLAQVVLYRKKWWDLPLRMGASTALLLLITAAAPYLGSTISGVLSTIPVIAWPLMLFTHAQYGRNEMLSVVRGNAIGALGVLGFYASMLFLLPHLPLFVTVLVAALVSVVLPVSLNTMLKRVAHA